MTFFIISFIAGCITVLAPCILPLLPVIVGGSISGERSIRRAIIVVSSLGVSIILFTFLLKISSVFIGIHEEVWPIISGSLIIIFGLSALFPQLVELPIISRLNVKANKVLGTGYKQNSLWGDILVGSALGPVFSTCSPTYIIILATVLPQKPLVGFVYLLAYTIGLCLSLLLISFIGQKIVDRLGVAADPRGWFKRVLGAIFIVLGFLIIFGVDKKIEYTILSSGFFDITRVEQTLLKFNMNDTHEQTPTTVNNSITATSSPSTEDATSTDTKANKESFLSPSTKALIFNRYHEIDGGTGYINTNGLPITIAQYIQQKKVVLIDFWTYSCINCQRSLPYVHTWYDTYEKDGLVIIGVHTPEFAFEKVQANVENAVDRLGIKYPVVLDSNYAIWNAYGNQYWPRKYLIDSDGYIVYDHIGEGNYTETEKAIQKALRERAERLHITDSSLSHLNKPSTVSVSDQYTNVGSPETYFGAKRNEFLANAKKGVTGDQSCLLPSVFDSNKLYLSGLWTFTNEYASASAGTTTNKTSIVYRYSAKDVYLVAASAESEPANIEVWQDGVLVSGDFVSTPRGEDVSVAGILSIKENRLYKVIHNSDYGEHTLEFRLKKGTIQAFTFTFG